MHVRLSQRSSAALALHYCILLFPQHRSEKSPLRIYEQNRTVLLTQIDITLPLRMPCKADAFPSSFFSVLQSGPINLMKLLEEYAFLICLEPQYMVSSFSSSGSKIWTNYNTVEKTTCKYWPKELLYLDSLGFFFPFLPIPVNFLQVSHVLITDI